MNTIEERIPNQTGETYLMPRKVSYCRIDASTPKARKTLQKWLDSCESYDEHIITRIGKSGRLYITHIGEVREGDWFYYPKYCNGCGIGVGSWKEFPRQTLDIIDTDMKGRFYKDHIFEAAKKIVERIKKDRQEEKEACERYGTKADFS